MNVATRVFVTSLFVFSCGALAAPMEEMDYQGKILVNDLPYTGSGFFKFAISDAGSTTNYWANDGTTTGEPSGSITNAVYNGVFSVILGAAPMTSIDAKIFGSGSSLYLRVWFSSGSGFSEMLPSQKIVSGAYAMNATLLEGSSSATIVSTATNAITLGGDVTGLPQANSIAPGAIVDADVNASAGIQGSKLQPASTTNFGAVQLAAGATGTAVIATGHPSLNAFSTVNSIVAGAPNSGFGIVSGGGLSVGVVGTNIVLTVGALPNLDNVKFVGLNGTPAGPGTIDAPYDTPQAGYDAAAAAFPGTPSAVVIAAGDYAASGLGLTMSSGTVHVLGLYRPKLFGLTVAAGPAAVLNGYQNVEGIVVEGLATLVAPASGGVRFHNCRLSSGATVNGVTVVFQDCYIRMGGDGGPALAIAAGPGLSAARIGVYQSSVENGDPAFGAIEIGYAGMPLPNVQDFEVIGCEIVNNHGAFGPPGTPGPAIQDHSPFHGAAFPKKLFAHNYIKGPLSDADAGFAPPTVSDPGVVFPYPPGTGPFLAFYNNTIVGSVGSAPAGVAHTQFYGNNSVLGGIINFAGGTVGWLQAGVGTGLDGAGNLEHEIVYPVPLPASWDD